MAIDESALSKEIGRRLKESREQAGMSQAALATEVGLTRTSITNMEAGRQRLTVGTIYAICSALHCDLSDVLPEITSPIIQGKPEIPIGDPSTSLPPKAAELMRSLVEENHK